MKKFKISVIIVMIGTLLSKALGLVREMLLAQKYGTGYISDAFIISLNIPTVLISTIAGAILTNYITVYADAEKKGENVASKFNGNLITISCIISTIIIIVFMFFTKPIVKIFAAGFAEEELEYLVKISRITIFCIYFIICSYIFKGFLEYKGKFIGTSLYGILLNIGMIAGIIFSSTEQYQILGVGVLLGYILSFTTLFILAKKNKLGIKINIDIKEEYLKKIIVLTLPILLNDMVWQINGIVDKSIASTVGEGYISAINYAHYIVDMLSSVFATSIVTVIFPNLVKSFRANGIEEVKSKTKSVLKYMSFIMIPCTILISYYSQSIVKILFYRGAFDEESLNITSISVSIYSIALLFVCIKTIMFKVFYALQDTKSPSKSAITSILLNIVLTFILVQVIGYKGIIIATVISSVASTILLMYMFKKKHTNLLDKEIIINLVKIIFAAILMTFTILLVDKLLGSISICSELITIIVRAIIGSIIGGIIYLLILVIIKFDFRINKKIEN